MTNQSETYPVFQPFFTASAQPESTGEVLLRDRATHLLPPFINDLGAESALSLLSQLVSLSGHLRENLGYSVHLNFPDRYLTSQQAWKKFLTSVEPAPEGTVIEFTDLAAQGPRPGFFAGVETLRSLRLRSAVDDVTDLTALPQLIEETTVDIAKLDASVISNLEANIAVQDQLAEVNRYGNREGLDFIVEGVERSGQLEILAQLGFTEFQGFLIGEPFEVTAPWKSLSI